MTPSKTFRTRRNGCLGWMDKDGQPTERVAKMFKTPTQGASTSLWAATSPQLNDIGESIVKIVRWLHPRVMVKMLVLLESMTGLSIQKKPVVFWDETERMLS
ncbi:MAG: hypothetical protein Ct9H300mP20_21140 [Gammaproteobacteria bacterium]|nr:MAG: hypothetical protein Ct9H300mP20_21140 [Gammaproteobacteria bacterium]